MLVHSIAQDYTAFEPISQLRAHPVGVIVVGQGGGQSQHVLGQLAAFEDACQQGSGGRQREVICLVPVCEQQLKHGQDELIRVREFVGPILVVPATVVDDVARSHEKTRNTQDYLASGPGALVLNGDESLH